jgi:hypothetical protein
LTIPRSLAVLGPVALTAVNAVTLERAVVSVKSYP